MTERGLILEKTNGGYDVFVHYMGECCEKKLFRNPFRTDNSPSCHLYYNKNAQGEGRFVLKDFGDSEWCGDCFWLVGHLCNIDIRNNFIEILRVIDKELNLCVFQDSPAKSYSTIKKVQNKPISESRPLGFIPKYRNFNKYEIAYWSEYGISTDTLSRFNVKCLSSCTFTRSNGTSFNISGTADVPMFGYTFYDGAGIKVYRPHAKIGRFMYAGSLPKPYIFGLEQLSLNNKNLIVTGGEKDVLSLSAHGFDAICLNSETAKLPFEEISKLTTYDSIVFLYDSDETGKRESSLRVEEWNDYAVKSMPKDKRLPAYSLTLPLSGTKQDKDVSDFFKSGHSPSELDELIKSTVFIIPSWVHFV